MYLQLRAAQTSKKTQIAVKKSKITLARAMSSSQSSTSLRSSGEKFEDNVDRGLGTVSLILWRVLVGEYTPPGVIKDYDDCDEECRSSCQ